MKAAPILRILALTLLLLTLAAIGAAWWTVHVSLAPQSGTIPVPTLASPVHVDLDALGVAHIASPTAAGASFAQGFLHARDRMFQMDIARRYASGRLSEIVGSPAIPIDIDQRTLDLTTTAQRIADGLPSSQRALLESYAAGVNAFLAQAQIPALEFFALGFRAEMWSPTDSVLVVLSMFQQLAYRENDERVASILHQTLDPSVAEFLTPEADLHEAPLIGGFAWREPVPIPLEALRELARSSTPSDKVLVTLFEDTLGSNAWVANGQRTAGGRAILANDMHLVLRVPSTWYRCELEIAGRCAAGVSLPGVPGIIAGANPDVAWGFANLFADTTDLVAIERNPTNANEYLTAQGWRPFNQRKVEILVKGGPTVSRTFLDTIWGPISSQQLLGGDVAIQWTGHDTTAPDFSLLEMHSATSVDDAIERFNRFSGPPQNVVLAGANGDIAWTICGRIPVRPVADGRTVTQPADAGWSGYREPGELPRVKNPEHGFLVAANQRVAGRDLTYPLGHHFAGGWRATRITELLKTSNGADERSMLEIQLDDQGGFLEYYRRLALSVLDQDKTDDAEVHRLLSRWNGRVDAGSRATAVLLTFRRTLAERLLSPLLQQCAANDPEFVWTWLSPERPLRELLDLADVSLLPPWRRVESWNGFVRSCLASAQDAQPHRARIEHPLATALPMFNRWLNMPETALPGSPFCLRYFSPTVGASERMTVSPGHTESALLSIPCGQSGNPFSPHYRDQHAAWESGTPTPFLAGSSVARLQFVPINQPPAGVSTR